MKVAIYVRVSTEKQEAENQLLQLREYTKKQDWEIYKEYAETISGKEEVRPEFNKLFEDAHKSLFDLVLFWDLSRFSRRGALYTLQKLQELTNLKIKWHSYQEPNISSLGELGNVIIAFSSTLAKIEREKISERTKAGLQRAKQQGVHLGRKKSKKNKQLIIDYYLKYKSINKAAKLSNWSYGTVYEIIKEWEANQDKPPIKNEGLPKAYAY